MLRGSAPGISPIGVAKDPRWQVRNDQQEDLLLLTEEVPRPEGQSRSFKATALALRGYIAGSAHKTANESAVTADSSGGTGEQ
jgi:hypothetical protein